MKKFFVFAIVLLFISSCKSVQDDPHSAVIDKITEFYHIAEVENYIPVSYSELDTTVNVVKKNGDIIRIDGILIHAYHANSRSGALLQYTDTFDITIFDDVVFALPRGYE